MNKWKIDAGWTLFLDRDGVLNERLPGDYVKDPGAFQWTAGLPAQLAELNELFGTIVVVTNQQGIGKGLMGEKDLEIVHRKMLEDIRQAGGRIDRVYYCGALENAGSFYRKPSVGMALQAKRDFPGIHFKKAVMVGDTLSDMLFGKRLGMRTVLVDDSPCLARDHPRLIDLRFDSLAAFVTFISGQNK